MRLTIARYYTPTGRSIQKPYNNGFDAYFDDLNARVQHGELEVPDSIHFSDSLKFTTPGGKVVYGGGGIMPDKFVAMDTTDISRYFLTVRPLIYRFALKYTESNRAALSKYSNAREIESYLDRQGLLNKFTDYASRNGAKTDPNGLKTSGKMIYVQLKAYIARNILDNKGFFPIWEEIDNTLRYAINYIDNE
jgi:carboxyl-terminal processing protease